MERLPTYSTTPFWSRDLMGGGGGSSSHRSQNTSSSITGIWFWAQKRRTSLLRDSGMTRPVGF